MSRQYDPFLQKYDLITSHTLSENDGKRYSVAQSVKQNTRRGKGKGREGRERERESEQIAIK